MKKLLSTPSSSDYDQNQTADKEPTNSIYKNKDSLIKDNDVSNILDLFMLDKKNFSKSEVKDINSKTSSFISSINNSNIIPLFSTVNSLGKTKIFWDMLYKFKSMNILKELHLEKIFKNFPRSAYELTCYKDFYNDDDIRQKIDNALLDNPLSFEYFERHIFEPEDSDKTYIDPQIINKLANNYIENSKSPKKWLLHMVEAILHPSPGTFVFSESVKSKADKKLKKLSPFPASASQRHLEFVFHDIKKQVNRPILNDGQCGNIKFQLTFPYLSKATGQFIKTVYIDKDSLSFKTGINGVFTDLINLLTLLEKLGVTYGEEFVFREIKRTPKIENAIRADPSKILLIRLIGKYIKLIKSRNIQIEKVFEWYYNSYINKVYNISGFEYTKSQIRSSFYSKCICLCVEIEKIIRQFRCLVQLDKIPQDYLKYQTNPVDYTSIPSFLEKKYYYLNFKKFIPQCLNFYKVAQKLEEKSISDQFSYFLMIFVYNCPLMRVISQNKGIDGYYKYTTMSDLFSNFDIKLSDIPSRYDKAIQNCFEYNLIYIDSHGFIRPDSDVIRLFQDSDLLLDPKMHISYYHFTNSVQKILERLEKSSTFISSCNLLSNYEQMYFDYILKNNLFTNGLNLRNKYLHGLSSYNNKENRKDYLCILSVMILLLFKINTELLFHSTQFREIDE